MNTPLKKCICRPEQVPCPSGVRDIAKDFGVRVEVTVKRKCKKCRGMIYNVYDSEAGCENTQLIDSYCK